MIDYLDGQVGWYAVATLTNYENKVASGIMKAAESKKMTDLIVETKVPTETETVTTKTGVKKTCERKIMPGYVFCKMVMTDETWNLVINITGAACIIGTKRNEPIPIKKEEALRWGLDTLPEEGDDSDNKDFIDIFGLLEPEDDEPEELPFKPGMTVVFTEGHLAGKLGKVTSVNAADETVKGTIIDSTVNATFETSFSGVEEYDPD